MLNSNEKIYVDLVNKSFQAFKNLKNLELINSEIFICGFEIENNSFFDSFVNENNSESFKERDALLKKLVFLTDLIIEILNRTESFCRVNILFRKLSSDTPLAFYENILAYFYSMVSIKTKFLENKKFIITFPQIFSSEFRGCLKANDTSDFNYENNFEELLGLIKRENTSKSKFPKCYNIFFVSAGMRYFEPIYSSQKQKQEEEYLDFIQKILIKNFSSSENSEEKYYLDYVDDYIEFTKFCKTEEKLMQYKKKKTDLNHSLEYKVLKSIHSKNTHICLFEFENVCLGGSFDHLHIGHIILLSLGCLANSKSLTIGITSDNMISKKGNKSILQPYTLRKELVDFLTYSISRTTNVTSYPINDSCGRASKETSLDCLVLTEETRKGGEFLNEERKKNNLKEIPLVFTNIIYTSKDYFRVDCHIEKNFNCKISSSYLRNNIYNLIPEEHLIYLHDKWTQMLLNQLEISEEKALKWFNICRDFYTQSWRKYHSFEHVYNLIKLLEQFSYNNPNEELNKIRIEDEITVFLSIVFHDVIYTPSRNDNEERSCEVLKEFIADIRNELIARNNVCLVNEEKIVNYILCTKKHFEEIEFSDNDLNLFLDFDLSGFSLGRENHLRNSLDIKFEFSHHLRESEWKHGRTAFLKFVLNKKRIYRTDFFYEKSESIARENIKFEIENPV